MEQRVVLEERKLKEIEHSDRRRQIVRGFEYETDKADGAATKDYIADNKEYQKHFSNMKFYSVTHSSFAYRDERLYKGIEGATVLDYCCGNGEVGVEMAARGAAKVYGIDISQVAVDNAEKLAQGKGVGDRCEFQVMDAENTEFADNTFDLIHEYGALHHLDLDAAFMELSRILKPGGKLVCTEALRHNPLIHLYRKYTPHLRTKWEYEHILGVPEINRGKFYFENVEVRFFHFASLGAVPLRKTRIFQLALRTLEAIDDCLLSIPYIRRLAWVAVIVCTLPKTG